MNRRLVPRPMASATRALSLIIWLSISACGDGESPSTTDESERLPGGETTNTLLLGVNAFIRPVSNLLDENEAAFYTGNSFFNQAWVEAPSSTTKRDGLGPFFNARACSACHPRDGRGAPPIGADEAFLSLLLRVSIPGVGPNGGPKPHPVYGDQFQSNAVLDVPAEGSPYLEYTELPGQFDDGESYSLAKPIYRFENLNYGPLGEDTMISPRVGPQVIGMGLLEAIPVERLEALSDPDDRDGDEVSGRINLVWDPTVSAHRPGRFGWKGDAASIRHQVAAAFAGDIGITSPPIPDIPCGEGQRACVQATSGGQPEIEERLFDFVVLYTSLVAVPVRRGWQTPEVLAGKALFNQIGCALCHVPRHVTGPHQLSEVSHQIIWPYTDLLLHDMGDALGDGRPVFLAEGNEWRTPPLWGVGLISKVNRHTRFLHDGRARNLTEAILWHGGEATSSQRAFKALNSIERGHLIRFVESL